MQQFPPIQLPLQVHLKDNATFDNYFPGQGNSQVVEALRAQLITSQHPAIYLYGPSGVGATHLLQAACHHAFEQQQQALYLPLAQVKAHDAGFLLEGLERLDLLCLDDVQQIAGLGEWEEALFHLYNRATETQTALLMAAQMAPRQLPLQLEDLQSRLSWGVVYQLEALSDKDKMALLQLRATRRGLPLNEELARFIVHRSSRHTADLLAVLDRLDNATLVQGRRLTIPFVKSVMDW